MNKYLFIISFFIMIFNCQKAAASQVNKWQDPDARIIRGTTFDKKQLFEKKFNKNWHSASYEEQERFLKKRKKSNQKGYQKRAQIGKSEKRDFNTYEEKDDSSKELKGFDHSIYEAKNRFARHFASNSFSKAKDDFSDNFERGSSILKKSSTHGKFSQGRNRLRRNRFSTRFSKRTNFKKARSSLISRLRKRRRRFKSKENFPEELSKKKLLTKGRRFFNRASIRKKFRSGRFDRDYNRFLSRLSTRRFSRR